MSDSFVSFQIDLHPQVEAGFQGVLEKKAKGFQILNQVHGAQGYEVTKDQEFLGCDGDFFWTKEKFKLGIFVADCTAILLYVKIKGGDRVGAIHAGWRGTAAGVIEETLKNFKEAEEIHAWMSPSICPEHFEVGREVLEALGPNSLAYARQKNSEKFHLDLSGYQKFILNSYGVSIKASSLCTFCQPDLFSYRRAKGQLQARQLAWIQLKR